MRNLFLLGLLIIMSAACLLGQPQRNFDWVRASDELVQLDPMEFHAGRVYRPGPDGGNMHVIIHARQPVTLAMTWAREWNDAQLHPETLGGLEYRCVREHVVDTTYECHLPPGRTSICSMVILYFRGPIQWTRSLGSVYARNTASRGASKVRTIRISVSLGVVIRAGFVVDCEAFIAT